MTSLQKIKAIDIIRDIRAGMGGSDIMDKYGLSSEQLQRVLTELLDQRQVITTQIVEDIRSGLNDEELMERYRLSKAGLELTFAKLVKRRFMTREEIDNRHTLFQSKGGNGGNRREFSRSRPPLSVAVHDDNNPANRGVVLDLTQKGIGVRGIRTQVDRTAQLTVLGDEFGEVDPFSFEGLCRWIREDEESGEYLAGFEIIDISPESLTRLLQWLRVCTIGIQD